MAGRKHNQYILHFDVRKENFKVLKITERVLKRVLPLVVKLKRVAPLRDHYVLTNECLKVVAEVRLTECMVDTWDNQYTWTLDKIKGTKHPSSEHPTPQKPTEKAFYPNLNIGGRLP